MLPSALSLGSACKTSAVADSDNSRIGLLELWSDFVSSPAKEEIHGEFRKIAT